MSQSRTAAHFGPALYPVPVKTLEDIRGDLRESNNLRRQVWVSPEFFHRFLPPGCGRPAAVGPAVPMFFESVLWTGIAQRTR